MLPFLGCVAEEPSSRDPDTSVSPTLQYADPPEVWVDPLDRFGRKVGVALRSTFGTGASYAVWYDGAIVWTGSVGTADPDGGAAPDAETLFEIGSDTKKLTAIALLQAVERGEIGLDDPISVGLPDFVLANEPTWGDTATVRQLLAHRSGLVDYSPWVDEPADAALGERVYGRLAEAGYASFPPDTGHAYTNAGYAVAGLLVEELTGRSWADVVADDIFAPLGLSRSFTREIDAEAAGNLAIGYGYTPSVEEWPMDPWATGVEWREGRIDMATHLDPGFLRPAGCAWSTAEDQARLLGALVVGMPEVLSDASLAELTAAQTTTFPGWDDLAYGFGLGVQTGFHTSDGSWYDEPLWYHGGLTMSHTSASYVLPERRIAVSVLSNGYGDATDDAIADLLAEIGTDGPVGTFDEVLPPLLGPDAYAGEYEDPHALGSFRLEVDGDGLLLVAPDLDAAGIGYGPTVTEVAGGLLSASIGGSVLFALTEADGERWLVDRRFSAQAVE